MTELLHNFIISLQEIIGYFLASRLKTKLSEKKNYRCAVRIDALMPDDVFFSFFENSTACETMR